MTTETKPTPTPEELSADGAFSIVEAARFLGVGRTEAFRLLADGELVGVKIGRRRLVLKRSAVGVLARRVTPG